MQFILVYYDMWLLLVSYMPCSELRELLATMTNDCSHLLLLLYVRMAVRVLEEENRKLKLRLKKGCGGGSVLGRAELDPP
jgi:hypothetical protein